MDFPGVNTDGLYTQVMEISFFDPFNIEARLFKMSERIKF